jgi:hypothetical protein
VLNTRQVKVAISDNSFAFSVLCRQFLESYFERRSHGAAPLTLNQTCARPPSTNTSLPVIKLLSSEARNKATAAVSSGFPTRSSGA